MPAELGRIDLGDVTPHNIKLLRKVNTVVFPVSYHDKFYKVFAFVKFFVAPNILYTGCSRSWRAGEVGLLQRYCGWGSLLQGGHAGCWQEGFCLIFNQLHFSNEVFLYFDALSIPAVHYDTGVPSALPKAGDWYSNA